MKERPLLGCLLWVIAIVGGSLAVGKTFFFEVVTLGHNGMAPSILTGERVVMWKRGTPDPGAISVCMVPELQAFVVGRVVATGGQKIAAVKGEVFVDKQALERDFHGVTEFFDEDFNKTTTLTFGDEYFDYGEEHLFFMDERKPLRIATQTVPQGSVYLLGDNRAYRGQDSRSFGPVPAQNCIGNIFMRLTPKGELYMELEHEYFDIIK